MFYTCHDETYSYLDTNFKFYLDFKISCTMIEKANLIIFEQKFCHKPFSSFAYAIGKIMIKFFEVRGYISWL